MTRLSLPLLILLLGVLLVSPMCGKKAPPFLPKKTFSLKVSDLKGEWKEGYIFLKGGIDDPGGGKEALSEVEGARVYYAQYPLKNPPCETCPIKYQGYHGFGPEVIEEGGFSCRVPGKVKGQIYFFKVHLIGKDGSMGPTSERIRLDEG